MLRSLFFSKNTIMDFYSLYNNQLDHEDLKGGLKNVVKWSYVESNRYPGTFLIVTCRWSAKIEKRSGKFVPSVFPIISPMFSAGYNHEFEWQIRLEIDDGNSGSCYIIEKFKKNSMLKYDFTISLLRNDLTLETIWDFQELSEFQPDSCDIDLRPEYLGREGNVISLVHGFIVDVTKFRNNEIISVTDKNVLEQLLENPLFSDVTLIIGEEQLKAHKNVLAINSQIFHDMLENSKKKESPIAIEIKDFQFDTIKEMLHFMYTGQLRDYGEESIKEILLVSSKYAIKNLFLMSEKALLKYLNVKNALEFLKLAGDVNATNVKASSIDVILNNIENIDPTALSLLERVLLKDLFEKMATNKKQKQLLKVLDERLARNKREIVAMAK